MLNSTDPDIFESFAARCVSLDLEVNRKSKRIDAIGAVRGDTGQGFIHQGSGVNAAFVRLDAFAEGASFILGHNIIKFDLCHLKTAKPGLRLLNCPAIDTLRLSPLAFPENPYHSLVKHYQDGGLKCGRINDPELDSRLALDVFRDQCAALAKTAPDRLAAWHWLCVADPEGADRAFDEFFIAVRKSRRLSALEARLAMGRLLIGNCCETHSEEVLNGAGEHGWSLAYALAWLSVAGGNSVIPPWVRHQFPKTGEIVRKLRDTACNDSSCSWCRQKHDSRNRLKRWFGFDEFRPEPICDDGRPMQQAIVEEVMAGRHVLGILPTGTGKSICYQVPALARHYNTGALTVVISPLVALMSDQVAGLEQRGIETCVTVNGMLSMPERSEALDRVRLGNAGILLISPEQLRSRTLRRVLAQREIGAWVMDEAHCLSRWGHDFRPDYRYVGRFIKERCGKGPVPPVLCLTATAKPDVIDDIKRHFLDELNVELRVFDGGSERTNLVFRVNPTSGGEKLGHIHQLLESQLSGENSGGAIIYCATRRGSEEIADYLAMKNVEARHFHAGLPPETKKEVQKQFISGRLQAIAATNAFGMGIDKPDVRLVIHADIPGSLENYLQEAGRAGRDRQSAQCVLLYDTDDVERQFGMSARSRLTRREIHGVLRALRNLGRRKRSSDELVATTGEILGEDEENAFERDSTTDDNRVRTAVAWLEEAKLLWRDENFVQIFPSSLKIATLDEAKDRLAAQSGLTDDHRRKLLSIVEALIGAESDQGLSTDELMMVSGFGPEAIRGALYDLERFGIASNDTALTAFVHTGVERSSKKRLEETEALEKALIAHMREAAPDLTKGESSTLHLRIASQKLRDQELTDPLPERLWRIIRSISRDGSGDEDVSTGSMSVRKLDSETGQIELRREWNALEKTAQLRREAAHLLLQHLLSCLPPGSRGVDLLAETTLGKLLEALNSDMVLKLAVRKPEKLLDRALLWLHEQEVIRLNKGLAVFRSAMTIRLEKSDKRGFSNSEFEPLSMHYKGQVLQVHVMKEFAERGLADIRDSLKLSKDYFELPESEFLEHWLPGRDEEIGRQTTPQSWQRIVGDLNNPEQRRIVNDTREQTNVLVLAGPGSGKTRVLVHRIAYLVRVRRENPKGILALAYNRHAAVEIRRRLADLIGDDAKRVTVLTCHALAMRLAGASFSGLENRPDNNMFREVLGRAAELLRGEGLPPEEADEQRERLLAGFCWILIDEYQDIGPEQYELISALAGRTLDDDEGKLRIFAVGDDDQNIYAFDGASVEYIRRFEEDYNSKATYLTANYRSSANIIEAANAVIKPARERMKSGQPIHIDKARSKLPKGGKWERIDPVSRGRVQIVPAGSDPIHQARAVMEEYTRLKELAPNWQWSNCAVIASEWKYLAPVRSYCEAFGIPSQMGDEEIPGFWRLRETKFFVDWLRKKKPGVVNSAALQAWIDAQPQNPWNDLLGQAAEEHLLETGGADVPIDHVIEWLAEWGREVRRRQNGLLLLTAHRAKGLEFDHVAVLGGGWDRTNRNADPDERRRLYYVAMTRARNTLTLMRFGNRNPFQDALDRNPSVLVRSPCELPPCPADLKLRHVQASLEDVDLGYGGRRGTGHRLHAAISRLSSGNPLTVHETSGGRFSLRDMKETTVGRMSKKFSPPKGMRIRSAKVLAIVHRSRELSDPKYHDSIKCEHWEVIVPEFVFEPER